MKNLIEERVALAREGKNPYVITKLKSGWVVIGDVQPLDGYCVLLSDPVVADLTDLTEEQRAQYCLDMARVGDALLKATSAYRINYEILGNSEPALHAHIVPRYLSEPDEKRKFSPFASYNWKISRKFDPLTDKNFIDQMRELLSLYADKSAQTYEPNNA